jgi:hypothetical protein
MQVDAQEAYDVTLEVTSNHLVEANPDGGWGESVPEEDARAFAIGEAAAYLADLDMMPDVRRAALQGIVAGVTAAGHPGLFENERVLADAVAEELNTAL